MLPAPLIGIIISIPESCSIRRLRNRGEGDVGCLKTTQKNYVTIG